MKKSVAAARPPAPAPLLPRAVSASIGLHPGFFAAFRRAPAGIADIGDDRGRDRSTVVQIVRPPGRCRRRSGSRRRPGPLACPTESAPWPSPDRGGWTAPHRLCRTRAAARTSPAPARRRRSRPHRRGRHRGVEASPPGPSRQERIGTTNRPVDRHNRDSLAAVDLGIRPVDGRRSPRLLDRAEIELGVGMPVLARNAPVGLGVLRHVESRSPASVCRSAAYRKRSIAPAPQARDPATASRPPRPASRRASQTAAGPISTSQPRIAHEAGRKKATTDQGCVTGVLPPSWCGVD